MWFRAIREEWQYRAKTKMDVRCDVGRSTVGVSHDQMKENSHKNLRARVLAFSSESLVGFVQEFEEKCDVNFST